MFVASATDLLLRVRYLYSPKEVWRFFKLYGMPLTYGLPFLLDTLPMILAGKAGYDNSLDFYYTHDGCHGASRTKTHSIYVEAGCYVVYFVVIFTALRDLHRNVRAVRAMTKKVTDFKVARQTSASRISLKGVCGGFTSFKRVVSRREGGGWSLFRF